MDDLISVLWTSPDGDAMAFPLWPGARLTVADIVTMHSAYREMAQVLALGSMTPMPFEEYEAIIRGTYAGDTWPVDFRQALRTYLHSTALAAVALGAADEGLRTVITAEEMSYAHRLIEAYHQFNERPPAA